MGKLLKTVPLFNSQIVSEGVPQLEEKGDGTQTLVEFGVFTIDIGPYRNHSLYKQLVLVNTMFFTFFSSIVISMPLLGSKPSTE